MLPSPPSEMNYPPIPKRRRTDLELEDQHDQRFAVTNLVTNTLSTFEAVSRLLRAHLPFSWLAPAGSATTNDVHPGSLVKGHVLSSGPWEYAVLVARRTPNGGLVAFEKIDDEYFVVYPLQPFVSEKWVEDASIGAGPAVGLQMMLHYIPATELDVNLALKSSPEPIPEKMFSAPKARPGAAARLSILNSSAKREGSLSSATVEDFVNEAESNATPISQEKAESIPCPVDIASFEASVFEQSLISTDEQPDMLSPVYLRQRYQDHLYTTKTSLAYYTKGPLSRARARARAQHSSMTMAELAVFYRESLLPVKRMDLKYKETIPHLIQNAEQFTQENTAKLTRRTRLGKDGLWPLENSLVLRWWNTNNAKGSICSAGHAPETRDAIASLRMREAQMQMILMLEALSLEAKLRDTIPVPQAVPVTADVKAESVEQDTLLEAADAGKMKMKKQRNLEADLELLADRLCIWHSVGLEGSLSMSDGLGNSEEQKTESRDRLRNFCVDVLIPFYSSRLPLLCKSLCKTLAGPEIFEQAQKAARLKDAGKETAPGTLVKRRPLSATGKELERVMSGETFRYASPPTLIRSSTMPPRPKFQREASELSQRPPSRSSRQASMSFMNREIDLVADAQATASKKRKLDRVASHKQDLAAAIDALKKPSRRTVSNAYMDEVEKRKSEARQESVQIAATPKVNRRTGFNSTEMGPLPQPKFDSEYLIPSSGTRPRSTAMLSSVHRSSSKKKAVLAAIHDTPSKAAISNADPWQGPGNAMAGSHVHTTTGDRETQIFATPSKPRSKDAIWPTNTSMKSLMETSSKQGKPFKLPDVAVKAMDRAMTMPMPIASTIYDDLGWNDDDDDM